ncbi:hypothetical protein [Roseomonas genomospecies 6]|uniref:Uncharacterized protein n=1 Tax=Roseomonas genomospecies 6 TaxID=214106 RepID=A0A9W7NLC5_9PROT|nr:hypothetical protein [Roseomonas genomospecies 6]KAA0682217.1 hypothetical protein DS843_06635 [Roseomonas genomospecies 6]
MNAEKKAAPTMRVRLMSPLGRYPAVTVASGTAKLLVDDGLIFTAMPVHPWEHHGFEAYSEVEYLAFEEIRFLAALALSMHPDHGMVYAYPMRPSLELPVAEAWGGAQIAGAAQGCLDAVVSAERTWPRGRVMPPKAGGPPYEVHEHPLDLDLLDRLMGSISLRDHLLLSGLNSFIKADMLWQGDVGEAAIQSLFVAMEVSFQLVLRVLKAHGNPNPTADDAGAFIDETFNPGIDTGRYFEEFYRTRIMSMHPHSRLGTFALAPLQADDYYFLRHALNEVFVFLITGSKSVP